MKTKPLFFFHPWDSPAKHIKNLHKCGLLMAEEPFDRPAGLPPDTNCAARREVSLYIKIPLKLREHLVGVFLHIVEPAAARNAFARRDGA